MDNSLFTPAEAERLFQAHKAQSASKILIKVNAEYKRVMETLQRQAARERPPFKIFTNCTEMVRERVCKMFEEEGNWEVFVEKAMPLCFSDELCFVIRVPAAKDGPSPEILK